MKMKVFKKGDKVVLTADGYNASDFNHIENLNIMGVYSILNPVGKIFKIEGSIQLISFNHDPDIFCAYLVKYKGKKIGFIYNVALKKIK